MGVLRFDQGWKISVTVKLEVTNILALSKYSLFVVLNILF